jgi:pyrimidine-specific ribonucleoside hydrolase
MIDILFDMETQDPDDLFTLCFLLSHPDVNLLAITLNPGSFEQIGLVRGVLDRLGRGDLPIGARNPKSTGKAISEFHFAFLGRPTPCDADAVAHELLASKLAEFPRAVWFTGAPLHNGRLLLSHHRDVKIERWVAQGGFAGDSLVSPEHRLDKFAGRETCVSHNFSVDSKAALALLASDRIASRDLVSKNVCHGVCYDAGMHQKMRDYREANSALAMIYDGMECYLKEVPSGKLFHDPLAASLVIDRSIATWAEVEVYFQKGEWGARRTTGTNTFITLSVDHKRFFQTLVAHKKGLPESADP